MFPQARCRFCRDPLKTPAEVRAECCSSLKCRSEMAVSKARQIALDHEVEIARQVQLRLAVDPALKPTVVTKVPYLDSVLMPQDAEVTRTLHEFLSRLVQRVFEEIDSCQDDLASLSEPKESEIEETIPAEFSSALEQTCRLCRGWCCKFGAINNAFITADVIRRLRQTFPELSAAEMVDHYVGRIPQTHFAGSCIFHSQTGCTLDRQSRSDVCNQFLCDGASQMIRQASLAPQLPQTIAAVSGNFVHDSAVVTFLEPLHSQSGEIPVSEEPPLS